MGMGGMMMGADGGDVTYPLFLINGRPANDPDALRRQARARGCGCGSSTPAPTPIFDVALAGHDLTVTHTDGYPVNPVTAQSLRIGMGERYDATVTLADGVFPLVAAAGRQGRAGPGAHPHRRGSRPGADHRPAELDGYPLTVDALQWPPRAAPAGPRPRLGPDVWPCRGRWAPYVWTINGRTYDQTVPLTIRAGRPGGCGSPTIR